MIDWIKLEDEKPQIGLGVLVLQVCDGEPIVSQASREMTAPKSPHNPFDPTEYWESAEERHTLNIDYAPITYWARINLPA